ncbi:MAG: DegV family protein [Clostridia bacterium]|nr:DegV family protein [Clostridia bacterium]
MPDFLLSCCSTVDLSEEHLTRRGVSYLPFHYAIDGVTYSDDLGKSLSYDEFYQKISDGALTETSQVNISEYLDFFTSVLEGGRDILHICLSSGLSGSYNSAVNAARIAAERFPERKIYVVDSLGASSGSGLLVDTLADLRDAGKSIDEVRDFAEGMRLRLHHWFFSTDLTSYFRGGRISRASCIFGGLLNICPLLNMDHLGRLTPRAKLRGKKKAISEIVECMKTHAEGGLAYSGKCYICNSACLEDAQTVAKLIEETFPNLAEPVCINSIGTTIGSHTGPGTVAVFFWGDERVN